MGDEGESNKFHEERSENEDDERDKMEEENNPFQNNNNILSENHNNMINQNQNQNNMLRQSRNETENSFKNDFINMDAQVDENIPDDNEEMNENINLCQSKNIPKQFPSKGNTISPITTQSIVLNQEDNDEQGGGNQNNIISQSIGKNINFSQMNNKDNNDENQSAFQEGNQMDFGTMNNQFLPDDQNKDKNNQYDQNPINNQLNNNMNMLGNHLGNEFHNNNNNFDINNNLNNNIHNNQNINNNFSNNNEEMKNMGITDNQWNHMNNEEAINLQQSNNFCLLNENEEQNQKQINDPNQLNNNQFQNQINVPKQLNNNQFQNQINDPNQMNALLYNNQNQNVIKNNQPENIASKYSNNKQIKNFNGDFQNQINSPNLISQKYKNIKDNNNSANPGNNHILPNSKKVQNPPQVQNSNPQENKPQGSSLSRFTKANRIGLKNLGKTSYLNSVLQLFSSFQRFISYFSNPKYQNYINQNYQKVKLSFVIFRLFTHFYPDPEKEEKLYEPKFVLEVLGKLNKVYKSVNRRNPNDLIIFILERLHNELNNNKKNNANIIRPDIYNKDNVIKCELNNFTQLNSSMVSNLLYWFEIKESKCIMCSCSMYKLLPFPIFELGILEPFLFFKKPLTIYDCLKFYEMPKKEKTFCQKCKKYTEKTNNTKILSSANTFIFSLDRKNLDPNYMKIFFKIDDKIDISNFVEYKGLPTQYELIGIVSFYTAMDRYICICLSPIDNQWYIYNDENIQKVQLSNAINYHNCENSQFIPCILAYKPINNQ